MLQTLIFILLIIGILAGGLLIPSFLTGRAIVQVVKIFRKNKAVNPEGALTIDELGLAPLSMVQRMTRRRDYKPRAMTTLQSLGVVQMTGEGKIYISEDELKTSGLIQRLPALARTDD